MAKSKGFLNSIFKGVFSNKISSIEQRIDNDPKTKELTKKLHVQLEELEDAVDDYIEQEMYE